MLHCRYPERKLLLSRPTMTDMSRPGSRLAAGPWWLLYSGPIGPTEPHAHRAAQLVVHGGGPCVSVRGEASRGPIVVIPPDALHWVHDHRDHALVLLVSPDSVVGEQLARDDVGSADSFDGLHPVARILGALRMSNWSQADEAVRRTLEHLDGIEDSHSRSLWRHRAFDEGLLDLPDGVAVDDVDVARLADRVGLAPARVSDSLTGGLGIPLGDYVRWLRLVMAIELIAEGIDVQSAAEATQYPGVDDLSRASKAMFALDPTRLVQLGTWLAAP